MSYALKLLLPYPVLCSAQSEILYLQIEDVKQDVFTFLPLLSEDQLSDLNLHTYVTGSRGEDLSVPLTFTFDEHLEMKGITKADLDLLVVVPLDRFEIHRSTVQTEGVHPGYFRYSGIETVFAKEVAQAISEYKVLIGQIHGPAIQVNSPLKAVDHVVAFQFFGWPDAAQEFCYRKRTSGWPSSELIKDIIEGECHMVWKPHPFTDKEIQNEWRFSFSLAEKQLSASLTKTQRLAFILLKLLHHKYFHAADEITSYHLKMTLFWECEKVPAGEWTSHKLATRLHSMINWFHKCLKEHNLPSFFIPENNLLDHIPKESIDKLQEQVAEIKDDMLTYIVRFLKEQRLLGSPISVDVEEYQALVGQLFSHENINSKQRMQDVNVDAAIRCASWNVADFYILEKLASDTTQYFMRPKEKVLVQNLIKDYLHNHMIPLQSAFFMLQEAWPEGENLAELTSIGAASEIFCCLTQMDSSGDTDGLSMNNKEEVNQAEKLIVDHNLLVLQQTAKELQTILDKAGDVEDSEIKTDSSKTKLKRAWEVLSNLVAYSFIILNSSEETVKARYLKKIQTLQLTLANAGGLHDLHYCSQQLEAFSLMTLNHSDDVEKILLNATLKPRATILLKKMHDARKSQYLPQHESSLWSRGVVSIQRFDQQTDEEGTSFVETWMKNMSVSHTEHLTPEYTSNHPVGKLFRNEAQTNDRTFRDVCTMRWERDTAHNLLLPRTNFLHAGLKTMTENMLSKDMNVCSEQAYAAHPSCNLAAAKILFTTGEAQRAINVIEKVLEDLQNSNEVYRLFPDESRLLLDDRVLAAENLQKHDHFDFRIAHYALFLLVKCHIDLGENNLAMARANQLERSLEQMLQDEDKENHDHPWPIYANGFTLLGTAQNVCGNKPGALVAFAHAALLKESTTLHAQHEREPDAHINGKSSVNSLFHCITMLRRNLCFQSPSHALRCLLEVLYPEVTLTTALTRLMIYCTAENDPQKERKTFLEVISGQYTP